MHNFYVFENKYNFLITSGDNFEFKAARILVLLKRLFLVPKPNANKFSD